MKRKNESDVVIFHIDVTNARINWTAVLREMPSIVVAKSTPAKVLGIRTRSKSTSFRIR